MKYTGEILLEVKGVFDGTGMKMSHVTYKTFLYQHQCGYGEHCKRSTIRSWCFNAQTTSIMLPPQSIPSHPSSRRSMWKLGKHFSFAICTDSASIIPFASTWHSLMIPAVNLSRCVLCQRSGVPRSKRFNFDKYILKGRQVFSLSFRSAYVN